MSVWQLQEAKSKFSRLVEEAINEGPQFVTKRGVESVVVISSNEYNKLKKKKKTLVSLLKNAPKANIDITRNNESIRNIEF